MPQITSRCVQRKSQDEADLRPGDVTRTNEEQAREGDEETRSDSDYCPDPVEH